MVLRNSPSGPRVFAQRTNDLTALTYDGKRTIDLTLQPAGHAAGIYGIARSLIVLAAATTGTVGMTVFWTDPVLGALSFAGAALPVTSLTATFVSTFTPIIMSSGSDPITLRAAQSVLVTGSPILRVSGSVLPLGVV